MIQSQNNDSIRPIDLLQIAARDLIFFSEVT